MDKETGFPLCQHLNGKVVKGPSVTGERHSVTIPLTCVKGSRVIGVSHHHPGGSIRLSSQDKHTAREKGLEFVCITTKGNKPKCYRFPKNSTPL